ncbi:transcription factor Tfb4 [Trichodelitschia bisporula]|uniref:General transcription and DNA repair factor IIH subunit TFB4 n=1 Tax=Trichodelitschia bisporula TaxID=703511 RepID=A0A6G1I090_9PEZI|nr:transcription factor Tfb4 [Trichodelitschia bisporula]
MDGIDATDHYLDPKNGPPPSLLVVILDTNPSSWARLSPTLPLGDALSALQIFINAHLAISPTNQTVVLASHIDRVAWVFPSPPNGPSAATNGAAFPSGALPPLQAANKYHPFAVLEATITASLADLFANTSPEAVARAYSATQVAGALGLALNYINRQQALARPGGEANKPNTAPGADDLGAKALLTSRILVLSASSDLSAQYSNIMSSMFTAQRLGVAIDVLTLAGKMVFLQQAADATNGVHMALPESEPGGKGPSPRSAALLQFLMMAYLPDATARKALVSPGAGEVDFRTECFCHQRVVDMGFVCAICLSIFCEPPSGNICLSCDNPLTLPPKYNVKPAVVPRKKKAKRKRPADGNGVGSGVATPADVSTPTA